MQSQDLFLRHNVLLDVLDYLLVLACYRKLGKRLSLLNSL